MSDLFIFLVGCVVSLLVASAIGLLLYGAAREPRGSISSRGEAGSRVSRGAASIGNGREAQPVVK